ncbi:MAG TPA: proteasome activator [Nitriliruptorales bacterium]|nr:proteasome activator [Nitriliruptorales bacterium]
MNHQEQPRGQQAPRGDERPPTLLDPHGDPAQGPQEEIEHPARLLRIAHSIRSLLDEVRTTDLDEAGRERLAAIHQQAVDSLQEIVSENLVEELGQMELPMDEGIPSGGELRVVQAQLAGWLEGLFRGIQASMASQQIAQQHHRQLAQRRALEGGGQTGQYL